MFVSRHQWYALALNSQCSSQSSSHRCGSNRSFVAVSLSIGSSRCSCSSNKIAVVSHPSSRRSCYYRLCKVLLFSHHVRVVLRLIGGNFGEIASLRTASCSQSNVHRVVDCMHLQISRLSGGFTVIAAPIGAVF